MATPSNTTRMAKPGGQRGKVEDGQPVGYWEWYRVDGTIKRSGHFKNGEPVGEWITYDKHGEVYKVTDRGGETD